MVESSTKLALSNLTGSLEDYLKTIHQLVRDQKVARVRDIARARGVRAASVTPAMRRLAELGLVRYQKREYIDLTPEGQREAQRIFSRHEVLARFFEAVLRMPGQAAAADACAMEHSLSSEGMDYLVRFLEFLRNCPDGQRFLELFHSCSFWRHDSVDCSAQCSLRCKIRGIRDARFVSLAVLPVGEQGRITRILGVGVLRDRLLDMGLLPDVIVEVARIRAGAGRVLRVQGFDVELSGQEACAVMVVPLPLEKPV